MTWGSFLTRPKRELLELAEGHELCLGQVAKGLRRDGFEGEDREFEGFRVLGFLRLRVSDSGFRIKEDGPEPLRFVSTGRVWRGSTRRYQHLPRTVEGCRRLLKDFLLRTTPLRDFASGSRTHTKDGPKLVETPVTADQML